MTEIQRKRQAKSIEAPRQALQGPEVLRRGDDSTEGALLCGMAGVPYHTCATQSSQAQGPLAASPDTMPACPPRCESSGFESESWSLYSHECSSKLPDDTSHLHDQSAHSTNSSPPKWSSIDELRQKLYKPEHESAHHASALLSTCTAEYAQYSGGAPALRFMNHAFGQIPKIIHLQACARQYALFQAGHRVWQQYGAHIVPEAKVASHISPTYCPHDCLFV